MYSYPIGTGYLRMHRSNNLHALRKASKVYKFCLMLASKRQLTLVVSRENSQVVPNFRISRRLRAKV